MAFHPFQSFRKHQRILFAVLTILCMFVFIFTGVGMTGNNGLPSWLGGRRNVGDKIVTLYGKDLSQTDVNQIGAARRLANDLVLQAMRAASEDASKTVKDYNPEKPDEVDRHLQGLRDLTSPENPQQIFQLLPQFPTFIGALDKVLGELAKPNQPDKAKAAEQARVAKDIRMLLKYQYFEISRLTGRGEPFYFGGGNLTSDDLLDFEIWKHEADKLGVVLTKADARRAIAYEAADHNLPADPGASWAADPVLGDAVKEALKQSPGMTEDQLATAVADEFRVETAKTLLTGRGSGVPALGAAGPAPDPDPVTPYDFWTYYRDNRTTLKIAFLPLPVDSFVSQVTAAPDPAALDDFFKLYRSQVPDPNSPTPGFKEPRKIAVGYLTAPADAPYYKDLFDHLRFDRLRTCVAAPTTATVGGFALAAVLAGDTLAADQSAAAFPPPPAVDPLSVEYTDDRAGWLTSTSDAFAAGAGLAATSAPLSALQAAARRELWEASRMAGVVRRARSAEESEAGELLGLASGGVGPFWAPAVVAQASANDARREPNRLAAGGFAMRLLGAGTPTTALAAALVPPNALVPGPGQVPEGIYTDLVERSFWQEQENNDRPRLVEADLAAFIKALQDEMKQARDEAQKKNAAKIGEPVEPEQYADEKAAQFIQAQARLRGWELKASARPEDVFAIESKDAPKDDPLQALKAAYPGGASSLAQELFKFMPAGLYTPAPPFAAVGAPDKFYTFWRTEDEREREYSNWHEAGQRVLDAWRFDQARVKARQAAMAISEQAKAEWAKFQPGPGQQDNLEKFLKEHQTADRPAFVLPESGSHGEVARLLFARPDFQFGGGEYMPYSFPPDKLPNIADSKDKLNDPQDPVNQGSVDMGRLTGLIYDPSNLVNRLLALDGPGQTLVFNDKPVKTFYVAVLEQRDVPQFHGSTDPMEFADAFRAARQLVPARQPFQPLMGPLWAGWFLPRHKEDYHKALMRQLRVDAVGKENVNADTGKIILADAGRRQQQQSAPTESDEGESPILP